MELVERIIRSKSFGRSVTHANLLRYLVDRSERDYPPKEIDIATDVLGKKDFDPSDSSLVRVLLYKLRKKLDKYYENEGTDEKVILEIPTGSYAVIFTPRPPEGSQPPEVEEPESEAKSTSAGWVVTAAALGLLLGGLITAVFLTDPVPAAPPVWSEIVDSSRPKLMVIGDLLVYHDTVGNPGLTLRNVDINSPEEFVAYRDTAAGGYALQQLTYAPVLRGATVWTKQLTELLHPHGIDFGIRSMTRLNPREIGGNDLVVAGMYKTLGLFRTYFPDSPLQLDGNNALALRRDDGTLERFTTSGDPDRRHVDYGVIRKTRGPNGNTIIIAAGLWDTATSQMVKNLTEAGPLGELTAALTAEFEELPPTFELLYRVDGIDRMELETELLWLRSPEKHLSR